MRPLVVCARIAACVVTAADGPPSKIAPVCWHARRGWRWDGVGTDVRTDVGSPGARWEVTAAVRFANETRTMRRLRGRVVTQVGLLGLLLCMLLAGPASNSPSGAPLRVVAALPPWMPQGNPMLLQVANARDRSWTFRWAVRLNVVNSPAPTLENSLDIATNCGDCRTVGISLQFNVVKRSVGTVSSQSDATSDNICTFGQCVTMGLVAQYTIIVDKPAQILPKVDRLMRRAIALLRGMFPHQRVSVPRVLAGFNALARLLVPHAPLIRLSTPSSSAGTLLPRDPPRIVVALVA
jgi:hypothetical protein